MIHDPVVGDPVPPHLLPASPGPLSADARECLWLLVEAIHQTWGDPEADVLHLRSQWLEFIQHQCEQEPSYRAEYESAVAVIRSMQGQQGEAETWRTLLVNPAIMPIAPLTTRLAHLRRFVIGEFIRVWLAAGGFRAFGAGNYNGYVSGSRFAIRPPYRPLA